jgi:hypothetical protein
VLQRLTGGPGSLAERSAAMKALAEKMVALPIHGLASATRADVEK